MHRIPASLVVTALLVFTPTAAANTLTVAKVHDGGTVEFEGGFTVHILGILVPSPETVVGRKAFDHVKRQLEGKVVKVFTWTTDNTAASIVYGDDELAFAKIMCGEGLATDIAAELLECGFAQVDSDHLPEGCLHYRTIETRAREDNVGIWVRD